VNFGTFLLYLLSVFVWVALISFWVFAMVDLFLRRDLSGWSKALWLLLIIFLPVLGTVIYFIARPAMDLGYASTPVDAQSRRYSGSSTEQLQVLADLADHGKLSPSEYEAIKGRIVGSGPTPA
jgi:Phospholipase_D-nuclease N-terminal